MASASDSAGTKKAVGGQPPKGRPKGPKKGDK